MTLKEIIMKEIRRGVIPTVISMAVSNAFYYTDYKFTSNKFENLSNQRNFHSAALFAYDILCTKDGIEYTIRFGQRKAAEEYISKYVEINDIPRELKGFVVM